MKNVQKLLKIKIIVIIILYFLLSFSLFYTSYKRYDLNKFTWDSRHYMAMVESVTDNETLAPWRYRIVTPFLVSFVEKVVPFYNTEITSDITKEEKRTLYYFMVTNYIFLLLASTCLFFYLKTRFGFSDTFSFLGGLMMLYSFNVVVQLFTPYVDAGLYFFVLVLLLLQLHQKDTLFFLVSLIAVLQKETVILVVGLILGLQWLFYESRSTHFLKWILLLVPSLVCYIGFKMIFPYEEKNSYNIFLTITNIFNTSKYNQSFFLQSLFNQLPLLAAFVAHIGIKIKKGVVNFPMKLLLIFPILYSIPFILGLTIGRFVSYGFPIYIAYELMILKTLYTMQKTKH